MAWYTKYLDKITPKMIKEFLKAQYVNENEINIMGVNWLIYVIRKDYNSMYEILNGYANSLDLPLPTLLHQILEPKCKDCKKARYQTNYQPNCDMIESWIPENVDYYSDAIFVLNEDEASPPLGCDCWEPK